MAIMYDEFFQAVMRHRFVYVKRYFYIKFTGFVVHDSAF